MALADDKALVDLEWPELLEVIASHAVSSLARERVRALGPLETRDEAEVRLAILREVLALHASGAALPRRDVLAVEEAAERARRHGVLGTEDFLALLVTLSAAHDLHRFALSHAESAPLLARALEVDESVFATLRELSRTLDETGDVRDSASPSLLEARRELKKARGRLAARLAELRVRYRDVLQDDFVVEREGRSVLPVRSDAPYRVDGTVFGSSASGATLYLEPEELAPLSNQVRIAESNVLREEAKVRAELSRLVGANADEVLRAEDVAIRGDLLGTIAGYATSTKSIVLSFGEPGELALEEARHPLLVHRGVDVVPCSLRLAGGTGLVISGPNAGGKTVALKTLGLSALLMSAGLPVPVGEASRIGFFDQLFADIGDDQSLSQSLSTFSGHVERVALMLRESGPGTLVLVDELMSGTDPNEGAVLAVSVLEAFVARGATAVLTTHYEALKHHAESHPLLENAAAGFDFRTMQPTFVIDQGRPGASSALAVAERFGLPKRVTERALALLPEEEVRRRTTLLRVEQLEADLLHKTRELSASIEEQRVTERALTLEIEKTREARRSELSKEADEIRRELMLARSELKLRRKELKERDGEEVLRSTDKALDSVAAKVAFGSEVDRATRKPLPAPAARSYKINERVRVSGLSTPATVVEILPKGQLRVMAGVMKLVVSADEVAPLSGKAPPVPASPQRSPALAPTLGVPLKIQETTLDLRGVRVEEGLLRVDTFLDELLRRQESGGYVLHGHGTGAMKDAVRQHLRGHAVIVESRACERDEGGDAWTVFWLRGMN